MKFTLLLITIIAQALLFSAMSLHPILYWMSWIAFGVDMIAAIVYWSEVSESDEISEVFVLLVFSSILIAVVTGGLIA